MNCFFCGTIRNTAKYMDTVYKNVIEMATFFDDYKIMLYYDVSNDNTLNKLQYYASINPRFSFYENQEPLHPLRTFRIAKGRNYLISQLNQENNQYPYFIMLDWDEVSCGKIDKKLLQNSLERSDEWDALSFWNSQKFYYDLWALSIKPYVISCFEFKNGANKYLKYITHIRNGCEGKYIPCYSAYGGLCIYKTEKFSNCEYNGKKNFSYIPLQMRQDQLRIAGNTLNMNTDPKLLETDQEDCEHRYFHFSAVLLNNARIRISPYTLFKS